MPRPIRVGAVNYLNTKPLIERLTDFAPDVELLARPAEPAGRPARRRRTGRRRSSRSSSTSAATTTRSCPDIAIASRGPVLSVTLFSRVPWAEIRSRRPRRGLADERRPRRRSCCASGTASARRSSRCRWTRAAEDVDDRRRAADRRPGDAGVPAGLPLTPTTWARSGTTGPACRSSTPSGRSASGVELGGVDRGACSRPKDYGLAQAGEIAQRGGAAAGARRRLLPALPEQHPPLRPRAAELRDAGPALAAGYYELAARAARLAPERRRTATLELATVRPTSSSKAVDGERLTLDEGVALFDCRDLHALGRAADAVTQRLHPEPYRTYNIDRNINYTNVCAAVCDFCAFYRKSATPTPTSCRARSCTRRSRRRSPSAATRSSCRAACTRRCKLEWYEELLRDLQGPLPAGQPARASARRRSGTSTSSTSCRCARCSSG